MRHTLHCLLRFRLCCPPCPVSFARCARALSAVRGPFLCPRRTSGWAALLCRGHSLHPDGFCSFPRGKESCSGAPRVQPGPFLHPPALHSLPRAETSAEPSLQAKQLKLKRARLADDLNEKIAQRPGPMELVEKNILPVESSLKEAIIGEEAPATLRGHAGQMQKEGLWTSCCLIPALTWELRCRV